MTVRASASQLVTMWCPPGITAGPDGALWFTELDGNKIGRITTAGTITEFTIPTGGSNPIGITAGPDGALWFTEGNGNKIGRITTTATPGDPQITEFALTASSFPMASRRDRTARCGSPNGTATRSGGSRPRASSPNSRFPRPAAAPRHHGGAGRRAVVHREQRQQDRADHDRGRHHRIPYSHGPAVTPMASRRGRTARCGSPRMATTRSGGSRPQPRSITEFTVPTANSIPEDITAGPDGALWFTEYNGNKIGRITTAGGNTAIVGGNGDNGGIGAAWVYTRSGGVWTQQGSKLVGTGAVGSRRPRPLRRAVRRRQHRHRGRVWRQRQAPGRRGSSPAAAVSGPSKAASWSAPARLERRPTRLLRRAVRRRQHRHRGRAWRQLERRGGVGLHPQRRVSGPSKAASWSAPARLESRQQGASVALSADGNTAIVGGYQRQQERRGGVGLHPQRRRLDPARAASWSAPARLEPPNKAPPSRCPPTATPPSWAGITTTRTPGRRGSSPAAAACGPSKAASWSAPARLEPPTKASPSRCPPTATPPSWAGITTTEHRGGLGLHPQRRRVDPARHQAGRHRRGGDAVGFSVALSAEPERVRAIGDLHRDRDRRRDRHGHVQGRTDHARRRHAVRWHSDIPDHYAGAWRTYDHRGLWRRQQLHRIDVVGPDANRQPGCDYDGRVAFGQSKCVWSVGDLHGNRQCDIACRRHADRKREFSGRGEHAGQRHLVVRCGDVLNVRAGARRPLDHGGLWRRQQFCRQHVLDTHADRQFRAGSAGHAGDEHRLVGQPRRAVLAVVVPISAQRVEQQRRQLFDLRACPPGSTSRRVPAR